MSPEVWYQALFLIQQAKECDFLMMNSPAPLKPETSGRAKHRVITIFFILIALLVVYPLSVVVVVSAYWLKTDYGYNLLKQGGWHAFSRCLIQEIPVEARDKTTRI